MTRVLSWGPSKSFATVFSLVVVTLVASIDSASASPCTPGTPDALGIKVPATVAFGRPFQARLIPLEGGWSVNQATAPGTFSFGPANPGAILPGQFTETVPSSGLDGIESPPIEFQRGESQAGVFSATWTQGIGARYGNKPNYTECEASSSALIAPVEGILSVAEVDYVFTDHDRSAFFSLKLACPATRAEDFSLDYSQVSTSPINVSIRGGGAKITSNVADVCKGQSRRIHARHLTLTDEPTPRGRALVLRPRHLAEGRIPIRFSARQAGTRLASGRFLLSTYFFHGRTIYEGSDAFVNYCIDNGRTIKSVNGRLYCRLPGRHLSEVTDVQWSPGRS